MENIKINDLNTSYVKVQYTIFKNRKARRKI